MKFTAAVKNETKMNNTRNIRVKEREKSWANETSAKKKGERKANHLATTLQSMDRKKSQCTLNRMVFEGRVNICEWCCAISLSFHSSTASYVVITVKWQCTHKQFIPIEEYGVIDASCTAITSCWVRFETVENSSSKNLSLTKCRYSESILRREAWFPSFASFSKCALFHAKYNFRAFEILLLR